MARWRPALLLPALLLAACRDTLAPAPAGWVEVEAGDRFTCARASDGSAWCWGLGSFGQLGDGATLERTVPVRVSGGLVFRALAAGDNHACGIASDGAAWCWGYDDYGELGAAAGSCNNNIRFNRCSSVPVAVGGGLAFARIAAAGYTSCGLAADGTAWCWGLNDHGQLGTGAALVTTAGAPAAVTGGRRFSQISLDVNHACALTAGGALFCWGSNDFGQLGADTLATPRCGAGAGSDFYCAPSPVAAAGGLAAQAVSAGSTHTCALDLSAAIWCWGSNQYGVLGNPAAPGGVTPVRVAGGGSYVQVSAGADHTCALDVAGAAWCWGLDTDGQLGADAPDACPAFGTARPCAARPVRVAGVPSLAAISAGTGHTCGLTPDGDIWCWGLGEEGQLGDGRATSSTMPVRVARP